jgi:hypothetical protein
MRWYVVLLCIIVIFPVVAEQPGIGLATPPVETLVIDSFPFTYQNKFRVYNTGDEERVFVISISAPYQDVLDWVTVDTSVFTLRPEETKVVQFSIYAESGYEGEYEVTFRPTLLPTQTAALPDSAMAHIAMSAAYILTIAVPEGAAPRRPQLEEVPPEKPRELTKTVEEMKETKASVVRPLDTSLIINVPPQAYMYEPTYLSVKFAEGEEPTELGFVVVAPSGESYRLNSDSVFSFDEEGNWSILVVIGEEIIAGNPVEVDHDFGKDLKFRILPRYGIFMLLLPALVVLVVFLRRRK